MEQSQFRQGEAPDQSGDEVRYSRAERAGLYRAIVERRDMRHFVSGAQVAPEVLERLLKAAHWGPSVGFMQPWRFMRITDAALRERHVFGRRTMPYMDIASVGCALENLWLAARAEGLGVGWVSIFDPVDMAELLGLPEGATPLALLCIGPVPAFYEEPMLQRERWARRMPLSDVVYENRWGESAPFLEGPDTRGGPEAD